MNKAETKTLFEVAEIIMGQSPDSESYNDKGEGIPFYQGKSDFGEIYPTVRMYCTSPKKIAMLDDILMSVRAPIGDVNIAQEECCIGRGLAAIRPKDNTNLKYLFYLLDYYKERLAEQGTGSTFKAIGKDVLKEFKVPMWPLDRQQLIADIIGEIQNLIFNRKEALSVLDNLVKSRFVEMFGDPVMNPMGWEINHLGNMCDIGSSKRIFEREYVDVGIPFYRTKEIVELSKGNSISTKLHISQERFYEIKAKYGAPQKNDLLVSAVGTIGIIWVVDGKQEFYFKDGNLLRISASPQFNSIYMKFLLEWLIDNFKRNMSAGTAYAALTIDAVKKMEVPTIPIALQNKFADFVALTDKSKLSIQQSIETLQTLKAKLMQDYFG